MDYIYKDKPFTLKQDNLKLLRILYPLLDKYNTLKYQKLKDIDRDLLFDYQKRINKLKIDIARGIERKEDIEKLSADLENLETDYVCDPAVIELNAYINAEQESIFRGLIFDDVEMLRKMSVEMVDGETEIFDFEDSEFYIFIAKVVRDFFLTMKNPSVT